MDGLEDTNMKFTLYSSYWTNVCNHTCVGTPLPISCDEGVT